MEVVRQQVVVAVAALDADGVAGHAHARTRQLAVVDGVAQGDVAEAAGADVAHGGEAGFQRHPGRMRAVHGGADVGHAQRLVAVLVRVAGQVGVGVDQARQHGGAGQVDDLGAGRHADAGGGADRGDALAADEDGLVVEHLAGDDVDQLAGADR
jgi:hypothetical protein